MEVDALKGKGKGQGKQPGKGGGKFRGTLTAGGSTSSTVAGSTASTVKPGACRNCGGQGHWARECPTPARQQQRQGQAPGKGQGQKGGTGKGKDGKTKSKQKSTPFQGNCSACGKYGHKRADCWRNVNAVTEGTGTEVNSLTPSMSVSQAIVNNVSSVPPAVVASTAPVWPCACSTLSRRAGLRWAPRPVFSAAGPSALRATLRGRALRGWDPFPLRSSLLRRPRVVASAAGGSAPPSANSCGVCSLPSSTWPAFGPVAMAALAGSLKEKHPTAVAKTQLTK